MAGGVAGRLAHRHLSPKVQARIRLLLALATLYVATSMVWEGVRGGFGHALGQLGIALLALVLGNALGMLLRVQAGLNRLGAFARKQLARGGEGDNRFSDGFITCALLFCVGPMSILGAIEDGLHGHFKILAVKSAMDGLATVGFTAMFGRGCMLAAVPVVAYQGTLTLCARLLAPALSPEVLAAINITGGLLVYCIVVIILDLRKVPLANYLPALVIAPLLTAWWL